MKSKTAFVVVLAAVLSPFATGAARQQAGQGQSQSGMGGQMMSQGMMGQMQAHHKQMSELMNKLTESMAAIKNEKDPAKLKEKLAEHSALLNQLRDQMMQQGRVESKTYASYLRDTALALLSQNLGVIARASAPSIQRRMFLAFWDAAGFLLPQQSLQQDQSTIRRDSTPTEGVLGTTTQGALGALDAVEILRARTMNRSGAAPT